MYFDNGGRDGGHNSPGIPQLSKTWYMAEGYTGGSFDEWVLIQNPGSIEAHLSVTYSVRGGGPIYCSYTVPARQRCTIHVDEAPYLGSSEVSTKIESDVPVAAERATYFVYDTTSLFSTSRALDGIWALSAGIGPRKAGTPAEARARDYIQGQFQEMGYEVKTQSFGLSNGGTSSNIIATKQGTSPERLVIGAHCDSKSGVPGANDNASGVGVLMELARAVKGIQTGPTIDFVAFGAEEIVDSNPDHHHFGSRYYVNSLSGVEKSQITGMISLDMVGVGSSMWIGCMEIQPKTIVDELLAAASDIDCQAAYFKTGGSSDHEAFERAGIPAAWIEWKTDPNYHSPRDTFDKIQGDSIEKTGRVVLEFILSRK
jgi:aminopeptidase YwaD